MLSYLDCSIVTVSVKSKWENLGKIVQIQSLWELLCVFVSEYRIQVLTSYTLPICSVV